MGATGGQGLTCSTPNLIGLDANLKVNDSGENSNREDEEYPFHAPTLKVASQVKDDGDNRTNIKNGIKHDGYLS